MIRVLLIRMHIKAKYFCTHDRCVWLSDNTACVLSCFRSFLYLSFSHSRPLTLHLQMSNGIVQVWQLRVYNDIFRRWCVTHRFDPIDRKEFEIFYNKTRFNQISRSFQVKYNRFNNPQSNSHDCQTQIRGFVYRNLVAILINRQYYQLISSLFSSPKTKEEEKKSDKRFVKAIAEYPPIASRWTHRNYIQLFNKYHLRQFDKRYNERIVTLRFFSLSRYVLIGCLGLKWWWLKISNSKHCSSSGKIRWISAEIKVYSVYQQLLDIKFALTFDSERFFFLPF